MNFTVWHHPLNLAGDLFCTDLTLFPRRILRVNGAAFRATGMTEFDRLQTAVLKDLIKMVIAGAGIIVLLALLLWGLVTSAEAVGFGNCSISQWATAKMKTTCPTHVAIRTSALRSTVPRVF